MNCNCRFCGDKNETINPIKSKCSKLVQKEYQPRLDMAENDDQLGIVQEIKIWQHYQMVYA